MADPATVLPDEPHGAEALRRRAHDTTGLTVLIIGAGAIGALVGGKLAQAGHAVTLVGRPHFAQTIDAAGLELRDERGAHHLRNVAAAGSIAQALTVAAAQETHFDIAILTVKSYDTNEALAELADALETTGTEPPVFCSFQNGVGNEDQIAARFGAHRVIAGTLTTPVSVPAVGVIQVEKPRYTMGLGSWDIAQPIAALADLERALHQAGFDVTLYPDARAMKWTKLLMNMLGNATSAILDATPQQVFADPDLLNIEIDAWREAFAVMRGLGITPIDLDGYPLSRVQRLIRFAPKGLLRVVLRKLIGNARGGKVPSLHIDLHGGKKTSEVDWLNGAVVQGGRTCRIPTPVNQVLTETMHRLSCGDAAHLALWRQNSLRLLVSVEEMRHRKQTEANAAAS